VCVLYIYCASSYKPATLVVASTVVRVLPDTDHTTIGDPKRALCSRGLQGRPGDKKTSNDIYEDSVQK